jgi:hypothetical protein
MRPAGILYVVTCGQCGQVWQRATGLEEGQAMDCIFCGQHGRLSLGAVPESALSSAPRVEAWLVH